MLPDFSVFQKQIGVTFHKIDFLHEACTHRSYLNENQDWPLPHNERLEFLGDAVLELAITEALFKKYPQKDEGYLTSVRAAMVNYISLAQIARDISLGDYLLLSRGEEKDTGRAREVILANAFEALLGAIYLDQGYEVAAQFIAQQVFSHVDEIVEKQLFKDAKSLFQERAQEKFKTTPGYQVISQSGPDHRKEFVVGVFIKDKQVAQGKGYSKQEAEVEAARNALESLEE
ncbi:MAG: ribonuclease III [Patescibacteria group bacterium]|nr:ribonuclease III [Patescibacteria group bacterium]